ncbi:MAG: thioredoxin family protein [Acidobacteriaceae bacterium]
MSQKRNVEVFTAGCICCDEAVALVRRIACSSCEVTVHDMKQESVTKRAQGLGIKRVPTVVIDGKIADCCTGAISEANLRSAGLGSAL